MSTSTVRSRWTAKLIGRRALLATARARFKAHKTKANHALIMRRLLQVGEAERILARHPDGAKITKVSPAGVALIAEFEGCSLKPYKDSVGIWTIGYGHTEGVTGRSKKLADEPHAKDLLLIDLNTLYAPSVAALNLPLSQPQFDALVSFVYNVGPGGVAVNTHVGAALRAHQWRAAADYLLAWDKAGGRRLPGLTRRRVAERAMFLKGTK